MGTIIGTPKSACQITSEQLFKEAAWSAVCPREGLWCSFIMIFHYHAGCLQTQIASSFKMAFFLNVIGYLFEIITCHQKLNPNPNVVLGIASADIQAWLWPRMCPVCRHYWKLKGTIRVRSILTKTGGFHSRGRVDSVTKETVARHLHPHHARHTGTWNTEHN